ncbi:MAG TPA: TetR/AcrR family transcriptional regulator [Rhodospirillales bacterium]|nr:TetR/AcrR family transcriptional regulator [Rhodospirillales bacterium]
MTRKTTSKTKRSGASGADPGARIIAAALELAVEEGWRNVSLSAIAAKAKLSLAQVHGVYPSKASILGGFINDIDQKTLASGAADAGDSARDRLFDVLMRRFDVMAPHKDALRAILRDGLADPCNVLCAAPRTLRSMAWMLEAAGLSPAGLQGAARVNGLALIYAGAVRTWLRDDTGDMAKTMAALDKGLARAEKITGLCARKGRSREGEPAAA